MHSGVLRTVGQHFNSRLRLVGALVHVHGGEWLAPGRLEGATPVDVVVASYAASTCMVCAMYGVRSTYM